MTVTNPFVDILTACTARFEDQIADGGDGGATVPTLYPNDAAAEPNSGLWARVTVREGQRNQVEVGSHATIRSRTPGVLFVEVFDDYAAGTANSGAVAERVLSAFQRQTISGVVFRTPYLQGGSSGTRVGKWVRITVACPFIADDVAQ